MRIKYSERVCVDLFIQHVECMRHIALSSVVCPALLYFSTLSHKRAPFSETLLAIKCVVNFSETFV